MDAKLTLKLDEQVIVKAKKYAADHSVSVSRLVETYLRSLTTNPSEGFEISPFIRSIATGTELPSDLDYKQEYSERLVEKL